MSSMLSMKNPLMNSATFKPARRTVSALAMGFALSASLVSGPCTAQDAQRWDQARSNLVAQQPSGMAQAISRWEQLTKSRDYSFDAYAGFVLTYPDFPRESLLRTRAENALDRSSPSADTLVAYFDRMPPVTNGGKARYALALSSVGRPEAAEMAREAWRGGSMSSSTEAYLHGLYGSTFTANDHAARMDALLWQRNSAGASRQAVNVPMGARDLHMARLALLRGSTPSAAGLPVPGGALSDPGYVYNLARYYRLSRQMGRAVNLLATRPRFNSLPHDATTMVSEMLRVAKGGGSRQAAQIAGSVDDLFPANYDVSKGAFKLRDDYTSLMWLGGTKALWNLGDGRTAAPLFYRYGAAARTPQTRSKGFYWAGLASQRSGDLQQAQQYWEMAATYPDRFYGMLALEKLGRPVPALNDRATTAISPEERAAFDARPITKAVRQVARGAPWKVGIQFYKAIANDAETLGEHLMVADLALQTGRRDLAVNLSDAAQAHGFGGFTAIGHPTLQTPAGTNWTMVHAIARQESQFAQNAISHAGARGLMQLMPGTAREQAGKFGMSYMRASLISDPSYNIRLGDGYFARMMDYYGGSYPLAIAAYNAGPGNVNKWLRRNGDPRRGGIDWVTWIEKIPIYETKNYVGRVIENAAVYEQLYPENVRFGAPRTAGNFLR
jgi:soluble lytic murein transglycosylase